MLVLLPHLMFIQLGLVKVLYALQKSCMCKMVMQVKLRIAHHFKVCVDIVKYCFTRRMY